MKTKDIIITAVSLFLICAVSAGILGAVNRITAPKIEEIQKQNETDARMQVLKTAVTFEDKTDGETAYAVGKDGGGQTVGYVFVTSASSYGGELKLMTGVDASGTVTGISILAISDTPGLGMNAKDPDFQAQFSGKSGALTVTKSGAASANEIDALTSATITSKAVTECVNQALRLYQSVTEKEG